jgi:exopolysaccharide production protein ExoZ
MSRLLNLQALRFVAAMSVLLFHATFIFWESPVFGFNSIFHYVGQSGVDVFFVISGFIIYRVSQSAASPLDFLIRRLCRVYPIYWCYFLLFAVMVLAGTNVPFRNDWPLDHWFANFLLLGWHDHRLVAVSWSLSFEIFFYICFSATLLFGRYRRKALAAWLVVELLLTGINHFVPVSVADGPWRWWICFNPFVLEFALGCVVGYLHERGFRQYPVPVLIAAVPFFVAGGMLSIDPQVSGLDYRVVTFGMGAALLVYAAVTHRDLWVSAKLSRLGDASYSLYLCQEPVMCAVRYVFEMFRIKQALWGLPVIGTTVAASIGVSLLSYRFMEQPIAAATRRGLNAWSRVRRPWREQDAAPRASVTVG